MEHATWSVGPGCASLPEVCRVLCLTDWAGSEVQSRVLRARAVCVDAWIEVQRGGQGSLGGGGVEGGGGLDLRHVALVAPRA